jgi:hypothetical protein
VPTIYPQLQIPFVNNCDVIQHVGTHVNR